MGYIVVPKSRLEFILKILSETDDKEPIVAELGDGKHGVFVYANQLTESFIEQYGLDIKYDREIQEKLFYPKMSKTEPSRQKSVNDIDRLEHQIGNANKRISDLELRINELINAWNKMAGGTGGSYSGHSSGPPSGINSNFKTAFSGQYRCMNPHCMTVEPGPFVGPRGCGRCGGSMNFR